MRLAEVRNFCGPKQVRTKLLPKKFRPNLEDFGVGFHFVYGKLDPSQLAANGTQVEAVIGGRDCGSVL